VAKQGKNIDELHYVVDLLQAQLPPDLVQQLNISFTTPDGQFPPPAVTLPAIDIFLYDVWCQLRGFATAS
jgi:hypothetical protein